MSSCPSCSTNILCKLIVLSSWPLPSGSLIAMCSVAELLHIVYVHAFGHCYLFETWNFPQGNAQATHLSLSFGFSFSYDGLGMSLCIFFRINTLPDTQCGHIRLLWYCIAFALWYSYIHPCLGCWISIDMWIPPCTNAFSKYSLGWS